MNAPCYIDVHILHTVPPANLNRDDNGDPKEAYFGGVRRSRVSSQAWKRATRLRFADQLPAQECGTRTKAIAAELANRLQKRTGVDEEQADRVANAVLHPLGISAGKKAGETAYLLFYGHNQIESLVDLIADRTAEFAALDDEKLAKQVADIPVHDTLTDGHPIDVALFGRMVADIPSLNVDAATQVAHAVSTHSVELEMDYYTAVDDQRGEAGAGMLGTIGFNSATLYRYASIGLHQLQHNLGEAAAARRAAGLFVDAFTRSMPPGYGNAFAHHTRPHLVATVVRDDQPVNLVSAFEKPVATSNGIAAQSAQRLGEEHERSSTQWGDIPNYSAICHTFDPTSTAADAVTRSFGANQPFSEVLTGLDEHLAARGEDETT